MGIFKAVILRNAFLQKRDYCIGVALITQVMQVHNKNSIITCGISDFPYHKELLLKERIR